VFITTKFYPARKNPVTAAERSLRRLGIDQIDLYIVHWPKGGPTWAWSGMERARELGHARSIGASNFDVGELEKVIAAGGVRPVVNQVQFSPFEYRRKLLEGCEQRGIALEAYSPLGTGRHLSNDTVARIASRLERTSAQVLLRWCVQRGIPVIPKSTHRERIEENARIFDFTLSDADVARLDARPDEWHRPCARTQMVVNAENPLPCAKSTVFERSVVESSAARALGEGPARYRSTSQAQQQSLSKPHQAPEVGPTPPGARTRPAPFLRRRPGDHLRQASPPHRAGGGVEGSPVSRPRIPPPGSPRTRWCRGRPARPRLAGPGGARASLQRRRCPKRVLERIEAHALM
jgi:diketogulonate reductase-like aldo/keto reductase